MPSREFNDFLQLIGVAGQTISGIQQIKDAQAKAEKEAIASAKKIRDAQAKTDFFTERLQNPLNIETVGGTPLVAPSGKPLGAAVLSGMFDKFQRPSDVALLERYRMLGVTPPEWLKARIKPFKQVTTERKPPKEKAIPKLTEADKDIKAHIAVEDGIATREQIIRTKRNPLTDPDVKRINDAKVKLERAQSKWDNKVVNFVKVESNKLPRMRELLLERQGVMFIAREQAPEEWKNKEWAQYQKEVQALRNIRSIGIRPTSIEDFIRDDRSIKADPRIDAAQQKGWVN